MTNVANLLHFLYVAERKESRLEQLRQLGLEPGIYVCLDKLFVFRVE